jgi:hypothetical protein
VLAEFLAFVKGKQGDVSSGGFGYLAGYYRAVLICDQGCEIEDCGFWDCRHKFLLVDRKGSIL